MGLFQIPEKELAHYIKEISSGREDVLEKFYKKYAKSMYTIIFSYVSSKESAEEVLQDVLMSIVRYGFNKPIKNARAWLFKVIRNASFKRLAEDKPLQDELPIKEDDIVSDDYVFGMLEDSIDQINSLKCLTPIEQKCVLLHAIGGVKLPKVAEITGISYDKTRNTYYYALRKLRQYYEKEELYEQQRRDQAVTE